MGGMHLKGTKIITTYKCNILCNNCEYKCAPFRKGAMPVYYFKQEIEKSINRGYDDYINIEGGETLLNPSIVYRYLKSIQDIKTQKYISTNGFWGKTEPYIDIILDLKKYDLHGIIIEYDYYHSVYIDFEVIKAAIRKIERCGLKVFLKAFFNTKDISSIEDKKTYEYIKAINNEFKNIHFILKTNEITASIKNENLILY